MKNWERFEQKLARAVGGRRTPGSGNGNQKGDIRSDTLLIEAKETSKNSLTIPTSWFTSLSVEAAKRKVLPIFAVEFGDGTTRFLSPHFSPVVRCRVDISGARSYKLKLEDAVEGLVLVTEAEDWAMVGPATFEEFLDDL